MEDSIKYFLPILANLIRFCLLAGIPFLILYIWAPNKFSKNKIQQKDSKPKDWIRELNHSIISLLVFSVISMLVIFTPFREHTLFYQDINAYPIWWIPLSIFFAVLIQDTYFYWMHRAIHHRKLFRMFHIIHHRSTNPTPLASHSFNISESILEALVVPIILISVPMHIVSILGFVFIALGFNVYGHLGHEIAPRWFRYSLLFQVMNTSVHHNLHHEKFKGNYGYYFRIWDRIMGTENPNYVKKYDEIQASRFPRDNKRFPHLRFASSVFFLLVFIGLLASYNL